MFKHHQIGRALRSTLLSSRAAWALALLLVLAQSPLLHAQGSGWTRGFGGLYVKVEQRALFASQFYNSNGDIISIPRTNLLTTSIYSEVGILRWLDAIVYLPVFVSHRQNLEGQDRNTQRRSGFGDIILGVKFGLLRNKPVALSVGLQAGLATGQSGQKDPIRKLQTGDGEWNQSVHVDFGVSLWPTPVYMAGGGWFNNRNSGFSDEIGWYFSAGVSFLKIAALKAQIKGLHPLNNGGLKGAALEGVYSTFLNNTRYLTYGGELAVKFLPRLHASLGADFATLGRNILAGPTFYIGVSFELAGKP